jgi:uridine kinase
MEGTSACVVLLCGPSGSGKSHIAARSGLPVFRLDDFYRDGDDPAMPRSDELGIVDWDDPRSWKADDAVAALEELCRTGRVQAPTYDIPQNRATGTAVVELRGAPAVVAEGVFAAEIIEQLRERRLLADAVVLHRTPWKNFVRRFARDLKERRKPPRTLWQRGRLLMAAEPGIVADACARGCRRVSAGELSDLLRGLKAGATA